MDTFTSIMRRQYHIHFFVILLLFHVGNAVAKQDRNSLVLNNDCSQTSVDYKNNPNLTQQEKIDLMDRALLRSLNKYEGCQSQQHAAGGSADGQSNGKGANQSDGAGDANNNPEGNSGGNTAGSATSTASSMMSGTETPAPQASTSSTSSANGSQQNAGDNKAGDNEAAGQAGDVSGKDISSTHGQHNKPIKGSGRVPGDIPPVDNDSVLEAQIRQAAINESDPVIKAKLWNEYRKYKGLPARKP